MSQEIIGAEAQRMEDVRVNNALWRKWGPYLSERQWGTVREDYSPDGTAWEYFPHDHARSRAYRWGEDGLAGLCDEKQQICFALTLWNGNDPFLKERLFGLTGHEGNHGEDVKEYYFYLDNIPSHAYMKYLYKYPQAAFPYEDLVNTNKARNRQQPEYELLDTGIFDEDRYFDIFVEYAKNSPEDILIQYTLVNRGFAVAELDLLPTLWFRNTWSWDPRMQKPSMRLVEQAIIKSTHPNLGELWLYADSPDALLFTENETNKERLFNYFNESPYVKDSFHSYIVSGCKQAVNLKAEGTKAAIHYHLRIAPGETKIIKLRLSNKQVSDPFGKDFEPLINQRKFEADEFYQKITPYPLSEDMRSVQRQAFSGLLWNKQCYHYNVKKWMDGDPGQPPPAAARKKGRNHSWLYLDAFEIFSMPDKWEYPWFAAWDLAFHTFSFAMIDPEFAKNQLILLTREWYMAPDGQIPAYEWNFSDVNPPVHAWAAMRIYQIEKEMYGREDRAFLKRIFDKLVLNFTWWVNRKDANGRNVFEGGFLGLDNIGAFDRSLEPPMGGSLKQPDATGWMGMYCLNCLQIALELAYEDPTYEDMATKFFEHFVYIGDAINNAADGSEGLWDRDLGFYYGLVITPEGMRIRMEHQDNMVGLVPLFAVATNEGQETGGFIEYRRRFRWFVENRPEMLCEIADLNSPGMEHRILLALVSKRKLERIMEKMLDETQFLSSYGIRSVSKKLAETPFSIKLGNKEFTLDYEPAESTTSLFGGNSNWRGPIWFPLNYLLVESLQKFDYYYGDSFKVECPKGSGKKMNLWDVSVEISHRLINIFLKDENGCRPVYGQIKKFQEDPHWREYVYFHEYFHGDNGSGLGASHQTGWTGIVAKMIHQYGKYVLQHDLPRTIEKNKIGHL